MNDDQLMTTFNCAALAASDDLATAITCVILQPDAAATQAAIAPSTSGASQSCTFFRYASDRNSSAISALRIALPNIHQDNYTIVIIDRFDCLLDSDRICTEGIF